MLKELTCRVAQGGNLSPEQAGACIREIVSGDASPAAVAAFLTAMHMKGETASEIAGGVRVLRELAIPFPNPSGQGLDTCGTGGDGQDTFNVSTAAAFVAAASGVRVIKHGNRSASGRTGSADVLEALGIALQPDPARQAVLLEETRLAFLFAPAHHAAMKHAAPVRRELGFRTIFNLLGPLANPAALSAQLLGVCRPDLLDVMARALVQLGCPRALVVHSRDGLDEISPREITDAREVRGSTIRRTRIDPRDLGLQAPPDAELSGGDAAGNARLLESLFEGREGGARRDFLLLNAGAAIWIGGASPHLAGGVARARTVLDDGAPRRILARHRGDRPAGGSRCF